MKFVSFCAKIFICFCTFRAYVIDQTTCIVAYIFLFNSIENFNHMYDSTYVIEIILSLLPLANRY